MHGRIPADPQCAIFPAAQACGENLSASIAAQLCSDPEKEGWFKDFAHALWPKKPAAALRFLTGAKDRVCHYWAAGREPPGSIIVKLLHSNDGERVLDQLMRDCKADWWKRRKAAEAKAALIDNLKVSIEQLELGLPVTHPR